MKKVKKLLLGLLYPQRIKLLISILFCNVEITCAQLNQIDSSFFNNCEDIIYLNETNKCYLEYNSLEDYSYRKCFFKNGTVSIITPYKFGLKHGVELFFYKDHSIAKLHSYEKGISSGLWYEYYENGNLKNRIYFEDIDSDSIPPELKVRIDTIGFEIIEMHTIEAAKFSGTIHSWNTNGKIVSIEKFLFGNKDGTCSYFDNGILKERIRYVNGEIKNR